MPKMECNLIIRILIVFCLFSLQAKATDDVSIKSEHMTTNELIGRGALIEKVNLSSGYLAYEFTFSSLRECQVLNVSVLINDQNNVRIAGFGLAKSENSYHLNLKSEYASNTTLSLLCNHQGFIGYIEVSLREGAQH